MSFSGQTPKNILRLLLPAAAAILAGCQNPPPRISVISPPPPLLGSAPVAAYDEVAFALKPQVGVSRYEKVILISER
ncbi:MAG TPA: hypothetical protein VG734_17565 [Lacunisphaera sp.]|nr:hypothetical protein [Lacunisphaera sp.]